MELFDLQSIYHYLSSQTHEYQIFLMILSFMVLPAIGFPMMGLVAITTSIYSGIEGIVLAGFGNLLAAALYFELARRFATFEGPSKLIDRYTQKYKIVRTLDSVFSVTALTLIVPFLPMCVLSGLIKIRRKYYYTGFVFGVIPGFIAAATTGAFGRSCMINTERNLSYVVLSASVIVIALIAQHFMKKKLRRTINHD